MYQNELENVNRDFSGCNNYVLTINYGIAGYSCCAYAYAYAYKYFHSDAMCLGHAIHFATGLL